MEIVTSRVSVYEIELDLSGWEHSSSGQIPRFQDILRDTIPSVYEHKSMTGRAGGFLEEVRKGTNFAHVIEHVLLELLHLADSEGRTYTGWTHEKGGFCYVVHYGAPDFLTGRLAAILGVELVRRLIEGEVVDVAYYLQQLKDPLTYFAREESPWAERCDLAEPISTIQEIEAALAATEASPTRELTGDQTEAIRLHLNSIADRLPLIIEAWEKAFLEYGGKFAAAILDKVALINFDKFMLLLVNGDFGAYFRAVRNVSTVINSYRIPIHFVNHSIWLFKNKLLRQLIDRYQEDKEALHNAIHDFEDFFQMVLSNVSQGFRGEASLGGIQSLVELKEFREVKERKGCILVVDDDEVTRRAFGDTLEYHGYRALITENGEQALQALQDNADEISLVILDLFMPDMSGREVYQQISRLRPDMKVLISSGYPLDSDIQQLLTGDRVDFIGKPFKVEEFLSKIRSISDETGGIGQPREKKP